MDTPAISPVPIAERVAAIADAGYCGFGLIVDDLAVVRDIYRTSPHKRT